MRATAGPSDADDDVLRRDVTGTTAGDFVVIFRVIPADPAFVGGQGIVLIDEGSRPIRLTEGIVLTKADAAINESVMERAHKLAVDAFCTFWHADDRFAPPVPAPPLIPENFSGDSTELTMRSLPPIHSHEELVKDPASPKSVEETESSAAPEDNANHEAVHQPAPSSAQRRHLIPAISVLLIIMAVVIIVFAVH